MVWFYPARVSLKSAFSWNATCFQSHYGLILSFPDTATTTERSTKLSIPLWSDFILDLDRELTCLFLPFNPTMVWFYLIRAEIDFYRCRNLSIPLWSDFIVLWVTRNDLFILLTFNPTMVWFYLRVSCPLLPSGTSLSIPLWSDFISWTMV